MIRAENNAEHWQRIYAQKAPEEVSWYEQEPAMSLRLIRRLSPNPATKIIDVGGGQSLLVDGLLNSGYSELTVIDIASAALAQAKQRLGAKASGVHWQVADIRDFRLHHTYDLWHDRATFHFLTDGQDVSHYVQQAAKHLVPGGTLLLATFAEDGPESCSGLKVSRYCAKRLAEAFAPAFTPVEDWKQDHLTPAGAHQSFTWCVFRRLKR